MKRYNGVHIGTFPALELDQQSINNLYKRKLKF